MTILRPLLLAGVVLVSSLGASAAETSKPYDDRLFRLSELLGSIHYLRELCGANEGQVWRAEMQALIDSEGSTALRKARLVASFNKGYRSFRRTYQTCTTSAEEAAAKFLSEGAEIAEKLIEPPGGKAKQPAEGEVEPTVEGEEAATGQ